MRRGAWAAAALVGAVALTAAVHAQEPPAPASPPPSPAAAPPAAGPPATGDPSSDVPPEEAPPPPPEPAPAIERPPPPVAPKPAAPMARTRHDAAILQATDKITAETLRFEARVGSPVRFKDLVITVRACETTAPDEAMADSVAHLEVASQPPATASRAAVAPRAVYRGWMFASSPGLHAFEHPVYDLWLITCRTVAPGASAASR